MSRNDSPAKRDLNHRVAVWSPTQTYSTYTQQFRAFLRKQAVFGFLGFISSAAVTVLFPPYVAAVRAAALP